MSIPSYVGRRIAGHAAVDIINKHGWASLGVAEFEDALASIEQSIDIQGSFAVITYTYDDVMYALSYDWKAYE